MELFEAKQTLINQVDQISADLKTRINSVNRLEDLNADSHATKVTEEFLSTISGGIINTGVEYTANTGEGLPAGKGNAWAHEQNALIMKQNLAQMAHNSKMFFEGKWSQIDNSYESNYWPVDAGK